MESKASKAKERQNFINEKRKGAWILASRLVFCYVHVYVMLRSPFVASIYAKLLCIFSRLWNSEREEVASSFNLPLVCPSFIGTLKIPRRHEQGCQCHWWADAQRWYSPRPRPEMEEKSFLVRAHQQNRSQRRKKQR